MVRSRRNRSSDGTDNSEDNSGVSRRKAREIDRDLSGSPIVPFPLLLAFSLLVIFAGFASEHYKKSRSRDHSFGMRAKQLLSKRLAEDKKEVDAQNVPPKKKEATDNHVHAGKSELTEEEDMRLEYDDGHRYHLIFSTDCSSFQHWQSYLVYFTAMRVRQPGHVTRIVSGCEPDEQKAFQHWFNNDVQFMSTRFHIHFTPHFSQVKDENGHIIGDYKFFNKPYGLRYWLETVELLGYSVETSEFSHPDDIVILIDPDMSLLRPITRDFSNESEVVISQDRKEHPISTTVERGKPFGQTYGLGTQWRKFDLDAIAGPGSPAKEVSKDDGRRYFPVGPPYIATVQDMYQIALKWTEFVPKVHKQYPYLLAEMYAYCIASAHLGLRHQVVDSLMISNTGVGGEGWPLIDEIPAEEVCDFARHPDHLVHPLPSVVHLCQRYCVGDEWFFGKRRIPHDIYACNTPLFEEPPSNLASLYDWKRPPNANEKKSLSPKTAKEEAFMVCHLTSLINDASMFYKKNACPEGAANTKRSRKVADLFTGAERVDVKDE